MNSNKIKHDVNDEEEDCEFEVITINPNQNYESDEEPMEDLSHTESSEKVEIPKEEQICPIREVNLKVVEAEDKTEETCDNIEAIVEDDNSMNSNDSMKKVRKKLNLQEYKMRRANEKPQPLFDLPRKIAAFELCDVPASLPNLVLPTDPKWISSNHKEIKKESTMLATSSRPLFNPAVYEEIIMVSNGCNTEITISPNDESDENQQSGSKFLKNIVNNLKKENIENVLNSSTSLFSSIQAVVQKRCASTETKSENTCDTSTESNNQGEDKVIMHLRKDRLRPFKCSVGLQTEDMTLFPPLLLSPSLVFNRIRNSRSYRRKNSRSRSRSRSFSPSMKYKRVRYHSGRYSRSQHSTHSSSMNSSDSSSSSESDSDSSDYSSSQSSSESLQHFNDRENFRFYNRNQNETQGFTYQEERKVVYIGGLEEETTKDAIRRKFLPYGSIKKITLHAKEDGLRYGFVTFADAKSAYDVIDRFSKDTTINNFDIRFGGRRRFCNQTYADLDSMPEPVYIENQKPAKDLSFEDLLQLAKKKLLSKK